MENKNNPSETPQTDGDVNAGGQANSEALKAQIASQNTIPAATGQTVPKQTQPEEPKVAATTKKYAGKFESDAALEEGYVHLEKKLGQKSEYERLGEKLHKYSGQDLAQLEAELDLASKSVTPVAQSQDNTPLSTDPKIEKLEREISQMKAESLMRKLSDEKAALFSEIPDAKKYEGTLDDLWKNVDTKKAYKEIYADRFASADEALKSISQDKSKEGFTVESSVGNEAAPLGEVDTSKLTASQLKDILPKHGNFAG